MANTFVNYVSKDVGTSAVTVHTGAGATQTTIIGLSCANTSASPVTVDVYVTQSSTDYYLIKGATVPVGGSLVVVGGDQKVVLEAADELKVISSAASSIDVFASGLEIT
jgi:hypothetical protein